MTWCCNPHGRNRYAATPAAAGILAQTSAFHNTESFRLMESRARGWTSLSGMGRSKNRHQHRPMPRLTQPLVRENGELRPATWDEALDRAAAGFRRTRDEHGGLAIGVFSCSKSTNEMNFVAQKLARTAFDTNNIDSCNRT